VRRRLTAAVVTIGGVVVLAVAAIVSWSWRSQLPDPVASHWGKGDIPNGFSSLSSFIGTLIGLGLVLVLGFGAVTWALGQSAVIRRIGAGATVWAALFLSIILVGTLANQRGLVDARDARGLGSLIVIAVLGSLVPAVIVAVAVPGDPPQPTDVAPAPDAPRARLLGGESTSWTGRQSSPMVFVIGVPATALIVGLAVWTRLWGVLAVVAVVLVLLVSMSSLVVRVDRSGLTVRSGVGLPRYRVPLDEIVRADVTQVSPLGDFGGWGWRVGRGGRVGVVLRSGEGLLVERTGGRSIVVTVDDAATAAGVINALADRARAH
jgi:hypothetical protein